MVVYPGDHIVLGRYDLDANTANGDEEIEWRVLTVKDREALLISKYVIEEINYNSIKEKITWEESSVRHWLNTNFLQRAFSDQERKAISMTTNVNDKDQGIPEKSTGSGASQEQVFLLSYREAIRYFDSDKDRIATTYSDAEIKPWWLRSISETKKGAAVVERDGHCTATRTVVYENIFVRPAIWVRIDLLPN